MSLKYGDNKLSERDELVKCLAVILALRLLWAVRESLKGCELGLVLDWESRVYRERVRTILEKSSNFSIFSEASRKELKEVLIDAHKVVTGKTENEFLLRYMSEKIGEINTRLVRETLECAPHPSVLSLERYLCDWDYPNSATNEFFY